MRTVLFAGFIFISTTVRAETLTHPAAGNFVDAGIMRTLSAYGGHSTGPYIVPRWVEGDFELFKQHLNYYALKNPHFKIGPRLNYILPFYSGDENLAVLGQKRPGYLELGVVISVPIPIGRVQWSTNTPLYNASGGLDHQFNLATALPLFRVNEARAWFNIYYEANFLSASTSEYAYGTTTYSPGSTAIHTVTLGYWFPWSERLWSTLTFKRDYLSTRAIDSPLTQRDHKTTLLLGLLWSFEAKKSDQPKPPEM